MVALEDSAHLVNRLAAHAAFRVLDDHLTNREMRDRNWIVGDGPTIADIALYAYTHCAEEGGYALATYRALDAWFTKMQSLPYVRPLDDNPEAEG